MAQGIVIPMRHHETDIVHWALWDALCIDTTSCGQTVRSDSDLVRVVWGTANTCVICASLSTRRS